MLPRGGGLTHKILSSKAFVGIGLISYSAYLWHQPLISFSRIRFEAMDGDIIMLGIIPLSLFLAFLTWKYIETPFRSRSGQVVVATPVLVKGLATLSLFFILIGVTGHIQNGYKNYYLNSRLSKEDAATFRMIENSTSYSLYDVMFDNGECTFWSREVNQNFSTRFDKCSQKFGKAVVVLGDSHAMNLYNIAGKADFYPFVVGVSQGGCRVHDNNKRCHYNGFSEFLKKNIKNIKLIIYHQSGSYFVQDGNGNVDSSLAFETGKPHQFIDRDIEAVMNYVADSNEQVKTIWMGPFVESRVNFKNLSLMLRTHEINPNSISIFKELDRHIIDMNAESPEGRRVEYISLVNTLNLDGTFIRSGGCITYRDTDHFSLCGEDILAQKLKPTFEKLVK